MKRILILLLLVSIAFAASWSLINPTLFRVHDYIHAARIAEMARGISDGQFPVRWSANFAYGYGMPLFEFYAPLPYAIGAVFFLVHVPLDIAVKLLFFIPSLLTALIAYKLGRTWFSTPTAVLFTAAITLAPYRALNLFVRGAVAESWGMVFLLLCLYGISSLLWNKKHSLAVFIVGLVGLVLSHNLTVLVALPVLIIWTIVVILAKAVVAENKNESLLQSSLIQAKKILPSLTLAVALAVGITTFYWLPALSERQFTKIDETILTGYFDYSIHFLSVKQFFQPGWEYGGSNWGTNDDISFFLGYAQIVGIVLTAIMAIWVLVRAKSGKWSQHDRILMILAVGSAVAALVTVFLSIQRSSFIWQYVTVLHTLQFPWRFLTAISIMTAFFSVIWLDWIHVSSRTKYAVLAIALIIVSFNATYFQPSEFLQDSTELYYSDADRIKNEMSPILPDFIPKTLTTTSVATAPIRCSVESNCSNINIISKQSDETVLRFDVGADTVATLPVAAFPGWTVYIDGVVTSHDVTNDGQLQVRVPAGEHEIRWRLERSLTRTIADITTAVVLTLTLVILGSKYLLKNKSK